MKIFNRIKNILFDEEEVEEIPVIEKKEPVKVELPKEPELPRQNKERELPEKEEIETRRTFSFPDLTEEIKPILPKTIEPKDEETRTSRSINVLDYEKKQKKEKTLSFRKERTEESEKKTAFKPSPVISPVYGIVEGTFESEPKVKKTENYSPISTGPLDVDSVRRKAYGTLEDDIVNTLEKNVEEFYQPKEEEKTIDELLVDDMADEVIEEFKIKEEGDVNEDKLDLLDEIDEELDSIEAEPRKNIVPEDTIESDLFNLIDSMYEDKEDGE